MQLINFRPPQPLMSAFHDEIGWNLRCEVSDEGVEIFLHGIVGSDWDGCDSGTVAQTLSQNKSRPVTMRVNSPGGLAYDGIAIYNALASHPSPTTALIEGHAGSAASLAVLGCDTIRAYESSVYQPHYAMVLAFGHQAQLRDALAMLETLDKQLEQIYKGRSGRTLAQVRKDLEGPNGDGTVFSASEAKSAGYVDEVIKPNKKAAKAETAEPSLRAARLRMMTMRVDKLSR